jgi:hypothetical protein
VARKRQDPRRPRKSNSDPPDRRLKRRLRCFPVCQGASSFIFDGVPVLGAVKVVPRVGGSTWTAATVIRLRSRLNSSGRFPDVAEQDLGGE